VRPALGVLAILGLLVGLILAVVIGSDTQQATTIAWTIQVLVLVGAVFLLASRMRRRS
jgi:type III secretory pathway component EscS